MVSSTERFPCTMLMYLAIASRLTDHTHCRQVRWLERELVSGALSPAEGTRVGPVTHYTEYPLPHTQGSQGLTLLSHAYNDSQPSASSDKRDNYRYVPDCMVNSTYSPGCSTVTCSLTDRHVVLLLHFPRNKG